MARFPRKEESLEEGTPLIEVLVGDENAEGVVIGEANIPDDATDDDPVQHYNEEFDLDARQQHRDEEKLVAVRPRRTVLHTRIGTTWYNFIEGREVMVPISVRDWLYEKKVL